MIMTIGDSVFWRQGLLDMHTFDRIYAVGAFGGNSGVGDAL